jgi:hypothetical protein
VRKCVTCSYEECMNRKTKSLNNKKKKSMHCVLNLIEISDFFIEYNRASTFVDIRMKLKLSAAVDTVQLDMALSEK